jgi:DNA repair protein RadD
VKELIQQNLAKLLQVWPGAPVGVYSASVGSRQLGRAITYATIGSIAKRAHQLGQVDIMLIDECHLVSASESTMYRKLIDELRRYCPAMRVVGWTGTAFRGDGVWLTQQGLFTHVAARVGMRQLLEEGYLSPLVTAPTQTRIDTSGVRVNGSEYSTAALAAASDKAELVKAACAELARLAAERKRWLVFAVTVEHAHRLADELRQAHGIACAVVSANTPPAERDSTIRAFKTGQLRALVNVAVLTTGFDAPEVDCIALLRATKSPVLYVQIAGRGMRTAEGKADCLWLDFTDTTAAMGPVDAIKGHGKPEPGNAPFKHCNECGSVNPASALECSSCGHAFPPPKEPERITHSAQASAAAVISSNEPVWHSITRVGYRRHEGRDDKPDTLRVDYFSGFNIVAMEWVCIEHPVGWARSKAQVWWNTRAGTAMPQDIDEALERSAELREPGRIATRKNGKYDEIVEYVFVPRQEAA